MDTIKLLPVIAALVLPAAANVVVLVETSDPGFYNNSLGTVLNDTNGGNTSTGYFPTSNDANVDFPVAPDLTVADAMLGDWLTEPFNFNSNWDYFESIPNMWDIGTEVAVIYQFDTLEATNVVASLGVDNGIYVWLDGEYLGGARKAGTVVPGEHVFDIGTSMPVRITCRSSWKIMAPPMVTISRSLQTHLRLRFPSRQPSGYSAPVLSA